MDKKLRIAVIILLVILLSLISFVGIYSKKTGGYNNILPEYIKGSNLTGKRITNLEVNEDTETKIYDTNGVEVSEIPEDAEEDDYTIEYEPINKEENLTEQNYKNVKEIIKKRLDYIGVQNYNVKLNLENGNIVVELPENTETDTIVSYLYQSGSFKIIDSDTEEILMDNSHVEKASVVYGTTNEGAQVYLDIKFTKEGKEKIREISNTYTKVEDTENETQRVITIMINEQQLLKTYFGQEITNGELTISVGDATKDETEIYEITDEAKLYAMMINCGVLPISYVGVSSEYVEGTLTNQEQQFIIYVLIAIVALNILYLVLKYKIKGVYAGIAYIGGIAIFLLAIRYTRTVITLNSLIAALTLIIINGYINISVLNQIKENASKEELFKNIKRGYLKILDIVIVTLVIAIVFTFTKWQAINSIGMMLFYGIVSIVLSHILAAFMFATEDSNKEND